MSEEEENVRDRIANSLVEIIASPARELSNIVTDQLKYYRWKSLLNIIERARQIRKDRNISQEAVPIKLLIPLLEEGSKEEEDSEMLEIWASLLANSDKSYNSFDLMCIELLGKLTHVEASVIKSIGRHLVADVATEFAVKMNENAEKFIGFYRIDEAHRLGIYVEDMKAYSSEFVEFAEKNLPNMWTRILIRSYPSGYVIKHPKWSSDSLAESFLALERMGLIDVQKREKLGIEIASENPNREIFRHIGRRYPPKDLKERSYRVGKSFIEVECWRLSRFGSMFWSKLETKN